MLFAKPAKALSWPRRVGRPALSGTVVVIPKHGPVYIKGGPDGPGGFRTGGRFGRDGFRTGGRF